MIFSDFKIAVVGAGAVGCYYGGKLAHSGCNVHFLLRSDLDAVQKSGLMLKSGAEVLHLKKVNGHARSDEIGACDAVIIALKTTANGALEKLLPPLLHEKTILLTLQNGLGNEEFLAERFGAHRVMGGLCFVCLNRIAPGVIEHFGHGTLSIGEFRGAPKERTHAIVAAFQRAGIDAHAVENLLTERWRKLVWNIPFNGLGIAARATVADVLADDTLRTLAKNLMLEVIGAAGKLGHRIADDFADFQINRSYQMGAYRSSSQIDFENGREVEVESIWGEPLRQARGTGAECGRLEALYTLVKRLSKQ